MGSTSFRWNRSLGLCKVMLREWDLLLELYGHHSLLFLYLYPNSNMNCCHSCQNSNLNRRILEFTTSLSITDPYYASNVGAFLFRPSNISKVS